MIIGIDSYHDKKRKQVSVAAFVATTNPQCTSYYSRIVMQTTTQELVDGISVCIRGRFDSKHVDRKSFQFFQMH